MSIHGVSLCEHADPATQISTYSTAVASLAVDGNTNGSFYGNSVTHTVSGTQDWWQVDLGSSYALETIKVWNRTDCCGDRLSNFYVFVSDQPFSSYDLTTTLNQAGVSNYYTAGQGGSPTYLSVNRSGRYVRVQLSAGGVPLSLAEVEVMGSTLAPANLNWLVTDHLGTPRLVFDKTGSLANVKRHDYLPFGEELSAGQGGAQPRSAIAWMACDRSSTQKNGTMKRGSTFSRRGTLRAHRDGLLQSTRTTLSWTQFATDASGPNRSSLPTSAIRSVGLVIPTH